ncbi:hypothetical protein D9758_000815 [Tetrapyrgos nigripes]|uniref:Uncharacterized protein n=1 Tax=Tetrapyrgos nigripes TaxID=182062 RepID=A0A8H5GYY5_9AGAR|nr:hypothetical protein D9758_000815 [Tetrapyrgos nigripes]
MVTNNNTVAETSRKPRNKRTVAPSARTLRNLPHRHPSPSPLSDITPTTPTGSHSRSTQPPQSLRRSPRLSPLQSPPEHSSPSVPPHSPISSSPTMPAMPTSTPANQPFLLQGNTKAPIVYARKLSLEDFLLVHAGIQQYIEHKEYHDKPVKARGAAMSVFTAAGSVSYFTAHRASLLAMSDQEFLQALLAHALGSRWQDAVSKKISSLQQDSVEDSSFQVLRDTILAWNQLLVGTPRHLTEPLIQSTLNNALSEGFTDYLYEKKQSNAIAYGEWCEAVEAHDEDYRAFRKPQMDKVNNEIRELKHTIQKQTSMIEQHKRGATDSHYSNNHARSKPFSSGSTNSSSSSTTSSSTTSSSSSQPTSNSSSSSSQQTYGIPPITSIREDPEQYQLLQDGQACHKCRAFCAGHTARNCPSTTRPTITVPYRKLTSDDIAWAKQIFAKYKRGVSLNMVLTRGRPQAKVVAAVAPAETAQLSPISDAAFFETNEKSVSHNTVAAVLGGVPFTHTTSGPEVFNRAPALLPAPRIMTRSSSHRSLGRRTSATVVAAMLADDDEDDDGEGDGILFPNDDEDDDGEGDGILFPNDDSPTRAPAAKVDTRYTVSTIETEPFHENHLLFRGLVDGPSVSSPLTLELLLDTGSPFVLISAELVDQLGLQHRKLHKPQPVTLFDGSTSSVSSTLTEYVRLPIEDSTGQWRSRPCNALIVPSLCSPLILGMPFLSRNELIVDSPHPPVTPVPPNNADLIIVNYVSLYLMN